MFQLLEAIPEAIYDLIKWKLNLKIVIKGVVISLVWLLLGWLMWPFLYGMASKVMDFLPFAILRSDGAYFFIAMVWALGTMVTFALVMMFFGEVFARKVSGESYNRFLPLLVIAVSLLWAAIVFLMFDKLYAVFLRILTTLPFDFTEKGVAGIIVLYVLYNGIVLTLVALSGLQSRGTLEILRKEKYPSEAILGEREDVFISTMKDIGIFVGISIVAFPLLFIPILNILIQFGLYIWLYRDVFKRDVCALYCNEGEKNALKQCKWEPWVISVIASLMSFIPFINFFAPYFGEVATFHFVMKTKDLNS